MTALAVRYPDPRPAPSKEHPSRPGKLPDRRDGPVGQASQASSLRHRFASDRDLIGLKIGLLAGLGLLLAALEFVV